MSAPSIAATPASEQQVTAQELDQARKFLEQTQNAVTGATKGLSEAQWRFKPAPDRWSIAENLDHIVIVQERVLGPILDQLANAPAFELMDGYQWILAAAAHTERHTKQMLEVMAEPGYPA